MLLYDPRRLWRVDSESNKPDPEVAKIPTSSAQSQKKTFVHISSETLPLSLSLSPDIHLAILRLQQWPEFDCRRRNQTSCTLSRPGQLRLRLIWSPTTTAPSLPIPGPSRASTVAPSTTTSVMLTPPRPSPPATYVLPPITGCPNAFCFCCFALCDALSQSYRMVIARNFSVWNVRFLLECVKQNFFWVV